MRLAHDRRHMMFAMRLERNILQQDNVVIAAHFVEDAREMISRIVVIAAAIFPPGPRHPLGRLQQAFPFGRIAGPADQRADGLADVRGHRFLAVANGFRINVTRHGPSPLLS